MNFEVELQLEKLNFISTIKIEFQCNVINLSIYITFLRSTILNCLCGKVESFAFDGEDEGTFAYVMFIKII